MWPVSYQFPKSLIVSSHLQRRSRADGSLLPCPSWIPVVTGMTRNTAYGNQVESNERRRRGTAASGPALNAPTALLLLLPPFSQGIPHQFRQPLPVHPGAEASLAASILQPLSLCIIPFLCHDALLPPATREGQARRPAPRNTVFRILWPLVDYWLGVLLPEHSLEHLTPLGSWEARPRISRPPAS